MKNSLLKTQCKALQLAILSLAIVLFSSTAFADEILIYSNEVFEQDANTAILDADNTGGDVILQFGQALNESLSWDSAASLFIISDDLQVEGNLSVDGNSLTIDSNDSGGNIDLIFGETLNEYLRYTGTIFTFSDDLLMPDDNKIYFRDDSQSIGSSSLGQMDLTATTEISLDAPTVDLSGDLTMSGSITGATIDGNLNTLVNIPSSAFPPVTKKLVVDTSELTVQEDGLGNLADIYLDSETGVDPHRYYILKTTQSSLQDLTVKLKVRLPLDFIDFSTQPNDIGFVYKNTGVNNTDSKIDITVEDEDGDLAFPAVDGQGLFSSAWTAYTDEFSEAGFDPQAGEYIYLTLKAYGSYDGAYQSPFMGEIAITYTGK